MLGIKSNLPAEIAPDVIIISILDFNILLIWFLKIDAWLSLKIPPLMKLNKKFSFNDLI